MSDALRLKSVMIEGDYYRVEPFPHRKDADIGPYMLKKGIAYRYETDITHGLFPYRGIIDEHFRFSKAKVGIWLRKLRHDSYKIVIVRPRTAKQALEYKIGRERDIVAAVLDDEYRPDQFMDNQLTSSDIGTEAYLPQIYSDDDFLNQGMKLVIRLKDAPFDPYSRRIEALAVDKSSGSVERSNRKNNVKRGIRTAHTCSPGRFMEGGDIWQYEVALVIRDRSDAMHRMGIPKGKMLVIYPSGEPFEIKQENLVNASQMIADAVAASVEEERIQEIKKKCPKRRTVED